LEEVGQIGWCDGGGDASLPEVDTVRSERETPGGERGGGYVGGYVVDA